MSTAPNELAALLVEMGVTTPAELVELLAELRDSMAEGPETCEFCGGPTTIDDDGSTHWWHEPDCSYMNSGAARARLVGEEEL